MEPVVKVFAFDDEAMIAVELVRSWESGNETDENHFQNNIEKGQSKSDWPFNLALKAL